MATSIVEARTSSISPERVCISVTTSIIPDSGVIVGMDHHVDAVAEDVQIAVGDQSRDLDEAVRAKVQPGHLAVDPHQFVAHSAQQ